MSDEKHKYVEHQNFPGTYRGLAEGGSGEIISLVTINKEPHIRLENTATQELGTFSLPS